MSEGEEPVSRIEAYLGDSVYVRMNSAMQVVIYTSNGAAEENHIVLEPEVMVNLVRWIEGLVGVG